MVNMIYPDESMLVPDSVYNSLPEKLKESCSNFSDHSVRDMYLLSQLTFLSACFPDVYGIYDSRKQYLNMNLIILAKASRGKSVTEFAAMAINEVADEFNKSMESDENYEFEPSLIIPANTSSAALISQLQSNNGIGLCYESELDTLSKSKSGEWNDYNDIIRKSFHFESISQLRRRNKESIKIPKPKLSFILTGTPKQILGFIDSPENGMYSRFLYYNSTVKPKFRDCRPSEDQPYLDPYYSDLGKYFWRLYSHFKSKEVYINLTDYQWNCIYSRWENEFKLIINTDEDFASIIMRYALMNYRLAMLLTVLRIGVNGLNEDLSYFCTDEDFESAYQSMLVVLRHAFTVYKSLPTQSVTGLKKYLADLLNKLPKGQELKRKDIITLWNMEGKESTADYRLKSLVQGGYLSIIEYGTYKIVANPS